MPAFAGCFVHIEHMRARGFPRRRWRTYAQYLDGIQNGSPHAEQVLFCLRGGRSHRAAAQPVCVAEHLLQLGSLRQHRRHLHCRGVAGQGLYRQRRIRQQGPGRAGGLKDRYLHQLGHRGHGAGGHRWRLCRRLLRRRGHRRGLLPQDVPYVHGLDGPARHHLL